MSDYETVWHGGMRGPLLKLPDLTPANRIVPVADRVATILAVITAKPQTIRSIAREAQLSIRFVQPILSALAATGSIVAGKEQRSRTGRAITYRRAGC